MRSTPVNAERILQIKDKIAETALRGCPGRAATHPLMMASRNRTGGRKWNSQKNNEKL